VEAELVKFRTSLEPHGWRLIFVWSPKLKKWPLNQIIGLNYTLLTTGNSEIFVRYN
jgi:hypothetical protein